MAGNGEKKLRLKELVNRIHDGLKKRNKMRHDKHCEITYLYM